MSEGTEATERVLGRLFEPQLEALAELEGPPKSAKSRLQEFTQRHHGMKPMYRLTSTSGPPHAQRFRVGVLLDGRLLANGTGSSRQRAEEQAADAALATLAAELGAS